MQIDTGLLYLTMLLMTSLTLVLLIMIKLLKIQVLFLCVFTPYIMTDCPHGLCSRRHDYRK